MSKKLKTYTVVRIENGFVEATSLKKAKKAVSKGMATITYSSEIVIKEGEPDTKFWRNLDTDKVSQLVELKKSQEEHAD